VAIRCLSGQSSAAEDCATFFLAVATWPAADPSAGVSPSGDRLGCSVLERCWPELVPWIQAGFCALRRYLRQIFATVEADPTAAVAGFEELLSNDLSLVLEALIHGGNNAGWLPGPFAVGL